MRRIVGTSPAASAHAKTIEAQVIMAPATRTSSTAAVVTLG